jgi:hypothetical protein
MTKRPARHRAPRAAARLLVLLVAAVLGAWSLGGGVSAAAGPSAVVVGVHLTGASRPVPRSFLGLSMEYSGVPAYSKEGVFFDRVVALLRAQDGSPMILRIGGKSADHFYWEVSTKGAPPGVTELGQPWMNALASLVQRDHMRVMLDLNLAVHSPAMAVSFAKAAHKALPRRSLMGLEVGNEPDLYKLQKRLQVQRIPSTIKSTPITWQQNYSPSDYRRDWISYARALKAALPNVPLGGPETISDKPQWLSAIEGLGPLDPGFLTIHRYASSNCWPTTSPWYPTIPLILGQSSTSGLATTVQQGVQYAHPLHESLRLTEVNSISCGGNHGVADSFATALWAPDALFGMVSEGVDGVSWHIRTTSVNAPFHPVAGGIQAMPELYGLAVFAQMIGRGARLQGTSVSGLRGINMSAWAVRSQRQLKVLLINKGPRAASAQLHLGWGQATVRYLRAPSISSDAGVTFGGQAIGLDALWHGRVAAPQVRGHSGTFGVALPGYSAAVVSF